MRSFGRMAFQPVEILYLGFGTRDDQIRCFGKPCDRQISLNPAFIIKPLGVNQSSRRHINIIGANAVQHRTSISALQPEFGKARLVEQANRLTHRFAFGSIGVKPVLPAIAIFILWRTAGFAIPVCAFPTERFSKTCAGCRQAVVQSGFPHTARCFILLEWIMRCVKETQAFGHPFTQIFAVDLEGHVAADIYGP